MTTRKKVVRLKNAGESKKFGVVFCLVWEHLKEIEQSRFGLFRGELFFTALSHVIKHSLWSSWSSCRSEWNGKTHVSVGLKSSFQLFTQLERITKKKKILLQRSRLLCSPTEDIFSSWNFGTRALSDYKILYHCTWQKANKGNPTTKNSSWKGFVENPKANRLLGEAAQHF